ncbi:MAG: twin-arginine translocation signal domain-containing protein [Planctomycetes bacterium]|nr:twin-arginine translocation signal domain-containing protein [Planctomycetota bacterium]MBL7043627.1 twin-arginine translocation signal domain-containing protein [Pirellulaceae bacterium]
MWKGTRRSFLKTTAASVAGAGLALAAKDARAQVPGDRPRQDDGVEVLNPMTRVPVSFIIDDSTCLVNLNRFAIPQFACAFNFERYDYDWRSMPAEIPDDFVRKFGHWCGEHGVKGKYSIVPYPACVGRLDRVLPGWTRKELDASIELVRTLMMPNWDIHPEIVTHTWAINTKTGHPYTERTANFQENWGWSVGKSVDELTDYMTYGLQILKNVGLPCEGITTPGGFGTRVLPELAQATLRSCRDVFSAEIPHYFRHIYGSGDRSVAPRVEYASGLDGPDPQCVVSIIGCTGDWTGGWDASRPGEVDRYITPDLSEGRMVDVIERGEPAIMVSHWTGIYFNGEEEGFKTFQEAVRRLHAKYDRLIWMKLCEIARYWAAKELTGIERRDGVVTLKAPFAAPNFTVRVGAKGSAVPKLTVGGKPLPLTEVAKPLALKSGTWTRDDQGVIVCFDLPKGETQITF